MIVQSLEETLRNDIAPESERIFKEHIKSDVYGAYAPKVYERRGLMQSGANIRTSVDGLTMTMTDETPGNTPWGWGKTPSGTQLSEIVDKGLQGNGAGWWPNAFPRPYVENTQKEVNDMVIQVLKRKYG